MTDNFDVLQLGVEPDEAGFDALQQNITSLDEALAKLQERDISGIADDATQSFYKLDDVIGLMTGRWRDLDQSAQAYNETLQTIAQQNGELETTSAGDTGGSTGAGGGVGSLFGVAHGVRAASGLGRMAGLGTGGTEALTGVADLLYLEQGLSKLSDIMPVVAANVAAGVEAIGGLSVAIPVFALVAAGVAALALVVHNLGEQSKEAQEELKAFAAGAEKAVPIIDKGTTQDVQSAQIAAASDMNNQIDIVAADIQHIRDRAKAGGGALGGIVAGLTDEQIEHSDLLRKTYADLFTSIDKAQQAQKSDMEAINDYTVALDNNKTAAADAAAKRKEADATFLQSLNDESAQRKQEEADLKLTAQANRDKQAALQDEYAQTADNIAALQRHGITTKEDQAALDAYMQKLHDLNLEIGNLAENLTKVENTEIAKATAKELQAEADATAKAEADKLRILQDGIQKDLDIRQAEADKVAELASKLADDEARVQRDTYRQFQDDWSNYAFNLNKLQVDAQRTETTDLQDHLQKVADINATAKADEFQAILDRNFLQIAKDEAKKTTDLSREDEHYQTQEQKLQQHLRNQEEDLARSLQHQMDQQRVAEQRKLDDLQTAEVRQIEVAQDAEIRSLNAERVHVINLYNVRVQAYIAEEVLLRNHLQNEVNIILGLALQAQQSAASGGSSVPAQSYSDSFYREIFQ